MATRTSVLGQRVPRQVSPRQNEPKYRLMHPQTHEHMHTHAVIYNMANIEMPQSVPVQILQIIGNPAMKNSILASIMQNLNCLKKMHSCGHSAGLIGSRLF